MSLADPYVQKTDHGDGSADFTVSFADEDHRFSASTESGEAVVEYEETHLTWRSHAKVEVSEPDEPVFRALMQSDKMTEFLEDNGLDGVRRRKH